MGRLRKCTLVHLEVRSVIVCGSKATLDSRERVCKVGSRWSRMACRVEGGRSPVRRRCDSRGRPQRNVCSLID